MGANNNRTHIFDFDIECQWTKHFQALYIFNSE